MISIKMATMSQIVNPYRFGPLPQRCIIAQLQGQKMGAAEESTQVYAQFIDTGLEANPS